MIDGLLYRIEQFLHTAPKAGKDASFRIAPAIAKIRELAPSLGAGTRVLSVGPRNMIEVDLLAAQGWHVEAVDLFPTDRRIRRGDIHRLPYGSSRFDLVFASHVVEHAHTPHRAIRELIRVARSGGYIWAAVPRDFMPNRHDRIVTLDDFDRARPGALQLVWADLPDGQRRFLFRVQKGEMA